MYNKCSICISMSYPYGLHLFSTFHVFIYRVRSEVSPDQFSSWTMRFPIILYKIIICHVINTSIIFISRELSEECPDQFISQFPNETLLCVKDLFAIISRSAAGSKDLFIKETMESRPAWLQTTFDLLTEMPQFVSFYQNREKRFVNDSRSQNTIILRT